MVLSNLSYDVITVLQNKLEGLEVYEIYIEDSEEASNEQCRLLFEEIMRDDERHAQRLRD